MQGFWCETNASDSHHSVFIDATWHTTAGALLSRTGPCRSGSSAPAPCTASDAAPSEHPPAAQLSHNHSQYTCCHVMLGGCLPASRMPAGRGRERRCGRAARRSRPPLSDGSRSAHSPRHPDYDTRLGLSKGEGAGSDLAAERLEAARGQPHARRDELQEVLTRPCHHTGQPPSGTAQQGQGMREARRTAVHRDDFAHQPLVRLIRRCTNHPLSDGPRVQKHGAMVAAHRCIPRPG
eukprot:COSAG04_NODE_500_length_13366_cov_33.972488_15_plen_236_part_00